MYRPGLGRTLLVLSLSCGLLTLIQSTCPDVPPPVLEWVLLEGLYYGVSGEQVSFTEARCLCENQPGNVRLAVLSNDSHLDAVRQYAEFGLSRFWLGATRPSGTGDYTWDDGCVLRASSDKWFNFGHSEPELGDDKLAMVAGIELPYFGTNQSAVLEPLCQTASPPAAVRLDANITWVYLANSSQIFGFSENQLGFYEARNACASFGSNVILANLDKYFYEIQEYVYNFRREQQIWVDASRPTSADVFRWSNGVVIDNAYWATNEPGTSKFARLRHRPSQSNIYLTGKNNPTHTMYYVCHKESDNEAIATDRDIPFQRGCTNSSTEASTSPVTSSRTEVILTSALAATFYSASPSFAASTSFVLESTRPESTGLATDALTSSIPALPVTSTVTSPVDSDLVTSMSTSTQLENSFVSTPAPSETSVAFTFVMTSPEWTTFAQSVTSVVVASETVTIEPSVTTAPGTLTSLLPLTSSQTRRPCCSCVSGDRYRPQNQTRHVQDVQEKITVIKMTLTVEKRTLSATVRKKISAKDSRTSAKATGFLGVIIVLVVLAIIVMSDVLKLKDDIIKNLTENKG